MSAGGEADRGGAVLYIPPGRVLRGPVFAPAVRGYPGGIADMAGDPDERLTALPFGDDLWEPGAAIAAAGTRPQAGPAPSGAAEAGAAKAAAARAALGPLAPGREAPARPSPGQPVSVWQQSAAAWQEAGIDWLRPGGAGAPAVAHDADDEDPHTEPIPALRADGSPQASRTGTMVGAGTTAGAGTAPRAGSAAAPGSAGSPAMAGAAGDATTGPAGAGHTEIAAAVAGKTTGTGAAPGETRQADRGKIKQAGRAKARQAGRGKGVPTGRRQTGGTRRRRRMTVASVTVLFLIAGTLAGIGIARSGGAAPAGPRFTLVSPYPPAVAADTSLAGRTTGTTPLLASLAGIAVAGQTVVAIGAAPSQPGPVPLFLVSTDGGHTWARGTVAGAAPIPGPGTTPVLIARGGGTWLTLGQHVAWTSPDGSTWRQVPGPPQLAGDTVFGLAGTRAGFVAVGQHAGSQPGPVVWTLPAGRAWTRSSGASLGLAVQRGHLAGLRWAAAEGGVLLAGGQITGTAGRPRQPAAGLWRSTDGGRTWSPITLPGSHGATGGLAGLAATRTAFLAIRSGRARGHQNAVTFLSTQGSTWHYAGKLTPVRRASLQVTAVSGNGNGFAVAAVVRSSEVAYIGAPGRHWRQTSYPGPGLAGLTTMPGGTVLVAGNSGPGSGAIGVRPHLLVISPGGERQQVGGAALAAAATPDVTVNGLAAAGGTLVAAGASGGSPALWLAAAAGRWTPAAVLLPAAWRDGALASVVHGGEGWLAVGDASASPAPALAVAARPRPVMLASAAGRAWAPASGAGAPTTAGISLAQAAAGPTGYVVVGSAPVSGATRGGATRGGATGGGATGGGGAGGGGAGGGAAAADTSSPAAWYSADLRSWTRVPLPGPGGTGTAGGAAMSRQVLGVTAARSGFVAVGSAADAPAVWTTSGGQSWQFTALPRPAGASGAVLAKVTAAGERLVAVGYQSRAGSAPGGIPFAAVSADGGRTWHESALAGPSGSPAPLAPPGPAIMTALTAAGHGFVALGRAGPPGRQVMVAWWSSDGLTWSHAAVAGGGWGRRLVPQVNAVVAGDGTLTGAGFAAGAVAEHPVFWHARYR